MVSPHFEGSTNCHILMRNTKIQYVPVGDVEPSHIICYITVKVNKCRARVRNNFWYAPHTIITFVHESTEKFHTYNLMQAQMRG